MAQKGDVVPSGRALKQVRPPAARFVWQKLAAENSRTLCYVLFRLPAGWELATQPNY